MKLRATLPSNWQGSCKMTKLLMPFHLFPLGDFKALDVPGGSLDNRVYLDSIGVLRSPR